MLVERARYNNEKAVQESKTRYADTSKSQGESYGETHRGC